MTTTRTCTTCRHRLTRAHCLVPTDCLGRGPAPYTYTHWESDLRGDAERDLHAAQLRGERGIHIDGEASVSALASIGDAHRQLARIAEACGYVVYRCADVLHVITHNGQWRLAYNDFGGLQWIAREDDERGDDPIWSKTP